MNKPKNPEVKKTLVRNSEHSVPKTLSVKQSKTSMKCLKDDSKAASNKTSKTRLVNEKSTEKTRFNTPEMYSTLKLSKKIDEVLKPRKTKSLSDVDKNKLAVEEKVSRKVNFPYGQSVFKDLIPLTNHEVKPQPILASRGPILQKDKEPVLGDFLEPRKPKIYCHIPSCGPRNLDDKKISVSATNSLRLYKILQTNEKND